MKKYLFALSFLFFSCGGDFVADSDTSDIREVVSSIAKEKKLPSLEISINRNGEEDFFSYHNPLVAKQSVYGIGSVTKFLTSALYFNLIEDGKISLDDNILERVPEIYFIKGADSLFVSDLLNHTSGIADYTKHPEWISSVIDGSAPKNFEEKLNLISDELTDPGKFNYSNSNYLILQTFAERAAGISFEILFDDFFNDIGLPLISLRIPEDKTLEAYFARSEDQISNVSDWKEYYGYDGGAYAESRSLNSLLIKLFAESSILNDSSLNAMREWTTMEQYKIPIGKGEISHYGYGIMKLNYDGKEYFGHMGGTLKYQAFAFYDLENKVAVSAFANCAGTYYSRAFFQEIVPAILDRI